MVSCTCTIGRGVHGHGVHEAVMAAVIRLMPALPWSGDDDNIDYDYPGY